MWRQSLAWTLGLALSHQFSVLPSVYLLLFSSLLLLCLANWSYAHTWWLAGLIWGCGHGIFLQHTLPALTDNSRFELILLETLGPQRAWGQSFLAEVLVVDDTSLSRWQGFKLWLTLAPEFKAQAGDIWQVQGRLRPIATTSNFYAPDLGLWLLTQNIRGRLNAKQAQLMNSAAALPKAEQLSQTLLQYQEQFPHTRLLPAILLGQSQWVQQADWQLWRQSGTLHLLVVSGGHLAMIAWLLGGLAQTLWKWLPGAPLIYPAPLVAVLAALILSAGFLLLVGPQMALWRAWLMLLLASCLWLVRRLQQPWRIWHWCWRGMLLVSPLWLYSPGFWLSFMAVALILLSLGHKQNWLGVQLWLFIGLAPFIALLFNEIYAASLWLNLIAIPMFGLLVLPISLFWLVAGEALGLGWHCAWLLEQALAALTGLQQWSSTWSVSRWQVTQDWRLQGWLGITAITCLLPYQIFHWRLAVSNLLCLVYLLYRQPLIEAPLRISMLDVGQGLSMLIETPNQVLLYDTGPATSPSFSVAAQELRARGWSRLDRLILSHEQQDHIGGLAALSQSLPIDQILRRQDRSCYRGLSWQQDQVQFSVLYPPKDSVRVDNDGSCVLLVRWQNFQLLLTGDLTSQGEKHLLALEPDLDIDLLQLGHHGSRYSSSFMWLRHLTPTQAWAAVGRGNHYGFPHPMTLKRLQQLQIPVFDTASSGALSLEFKETNTMPIFRLRLLRQTWLMRLSHGSAE